MKYLTVLCCLALGVSARTKDQRTTLEDIERDYLTNQKKSKPNQSSKVAASPSPTHFGFVPTKTLADYVQRDPKPAFAQLQYVPQYQQDDYPQHVAPASQRYTTSFKQYSVPLQQVSRASQKQSPQQALTQAQQVYKYVPQAQAQYPGFEDVQYVTDNSLAQGGQQYYTPQYVYLQQYPSPSTAVQTVVEPKGGIQYVMYIPTYVPNTASDQSQNYENVVYTPTATQDDTPSTRPSIYQAPQSPSQAHYTSSSSQKEQVRYVQPKAKYAKTEYVVRREPKSLLDSYVPSVVQLQYYNQAQQNSIQEPVKLTQSVRPKNTKSEYRPAEPSGAEASLTYRYQPVSLYRS